MNRVHTVGSAKIVLGTGNVDADGAPDAYGPNNSGTDLTSDAGHPGNWWALVIRGGNPVIQGPNDPNPGDYVSTTALFDPSFPTSDPRHWVNADTIPFAVIPGSPHFGVAIGDYGFALRLDTGDSSPIIVADSGPDGQLGEISIAAAKNLNLNPSPRDGGTQANKILYVFFPGSSKGWSNATTAEDVLSAANQLLLALGGIDALRSLPFDLSKF
jgi:hypothetical protein